MQRIAQFKIQVKHLYKKNGYGKSLNIKPVMQLKPWTNQVYGKIQSLFSFVAEFFKSL